MVLPLPALGTGGDTDSDAHSQPDTDTEACRAGHTAWFGTGVLRQSRERVGIRNAADVRSMQRALIAKKYATPALRWAGATGNYLTQTKLSVATLQRRLGYRGADADGIIGPYSARALGLRWVKK